MCKKRINFCKKYIDWTVDYWKKVLFSDESSLAMIEKKITITMKIHQTSNLCMMGHHVTGQK